MIKLNLNETQLKDLMKTAILEVVQERRDLFQDLITEALEEIAPIKTIDKDSEPAPADDSADFIQQLLDHPLAIVDLAPADRDELYDR